MADRVECGCDKGDTYMSRKTAHRKFKRRRKMGSKQRAARRANRIK